MSETKQIATVINELQDTKQLCALLMQTPHYAKMGPEGVFAVVETAKSLGIDPRQALGGGLYYVKGKVEMSSRMMNSLIRAQKHSITRDPKSDDTICILHGKRADNGDTWTESFSMQDAQRAGLANSNVWKNFGRDMLFARALSRLARQLFPDVIGNVYVEGEISLDANITAPKILQMPAQEEAVSTTITEEQQEAIMAEIGPHVEIIDAMKMAFKIDLLCDLPSHHYEKVLTAIRKRIEKKTASIEEKTG